MENELAALAFIFFIIHTVNNCGRANRLPEIMVLSSSYTANAYPDFSFHAVFVYWSKNFSCKKSLEASNHLGILFERFFGGLIGAPFSLLLFFVPYVGMGYAFVSLIPLTVLLE